MMKQPRAGQSHDDVVFVAGFDNDVVADGAAGLGNVADAALLGAVDAVAEGEEGV